MLWYLDYAINYTEQLSISHVGCYLRCSTKVYLIISAGRGGRSIDNTTLYCGSIMMHSHSWKPSQKFDDVKSVLSSCSYWLQLIFDLSMKNTQEVQLSNFTFFWNLVPTEVNRFSKWDTQLSYQTTANDHLKIGVTRISFSSQYNSPPSIWKCLQRKLTGWPMKCCFFFISPSTM